jgi:hypothetical protein
LIGSTADSISESLSTSTARKQLRAVLEIKKAV